MEDLSQSQLWRRKRRLLNTIETVAVNEEPGMKCLSMTVQRDENLEYLHFGATPGKTHSDSVLLAKERFNISSKYIQMVNACHHMYFNIIFPLILQTRGTRSYAS